MTIHEYFMKAIQDDARRAGERDRLLLEARRARGARRRTGIGKIALSHNVTLDAVMQDPAIEGFRDGGWVGLIARRAVAISQGRAGRPAHSSVSRR